MHNRRHIVPMFSAPLAGLVFATSYAGLKVPGCYALETAAWRQQCIAENNFDLFVTTPSLLITAIAAWRGGSRALQLWAGVVLYVLYMFIIYCFDVHFNTLFPVYCAALGLSAYALFYFCYQLLCGRVNDGMRGMSAAPITGIYFIGLSCIFYYLWLADIIPAIKLHTIPQGLAATGLFTNPVHVIDLSVLLPGLFITGIALLKGRAWAKAIAPALLTFSVLMIASIGWMVYFTALH